MTLVGRERELAELRHVRESGRPELVAVYGRRRIGKTFLIRTYFEKDMAFELTGVRDASLGQQLQNFAHALAAKTGYSHQRPDDWGAAFQELILYLGKQPKDRRAVIFFDELPWLAGRRSGFLPAFEHFWNAWASQQNHVVVVICGSAASWMIAKVLDQRGGLHNRVTLALPLRPFTLHESEQFLRSRGITLERPQLLELIMATGGSPYYLGYVRRGRSAAQNIDLMFFASQAPLRDEFDKLFAALFEHHERHLQVVYALARKQSGLSRNELVAATKLESGGNMTSILQELEASGFICRVARFGRQIRDPLYRLIDEFTLFHVRWLQGRQALHEGEGRWASIRGTPAWYAWTGYGFENLCLRHVAQIKAALGIAGVQTEISSWRHRGETSGAGAQIDLLIDRRDGVINVCEMKFSEGAFVIEKRYAGELQNKLVVFRSQTKTRKSLLLTMVVPEGVAENPWKNSLVEAVVGADALFRA